MGLGLAAAAVATFRTFSLGLGIVAHLASVPAMAINPPLALALHAVGDASLSCAAAPPGMNPVENYIVATAAVSSPL